MNRNLPRVLSVVASLLAAASGSGCSGSSAIDLGDSGASGPHGGPGANDSGGTEGSAGGSGSGNDASSTGDASGASGEGGSAEAGDAGGAAGEGAAAGDGGAGCKRGIAAKTPPGAAFFPAIGWWYNWSVPTSGTNVGIEFVPMIWGSGSVSAALPASSKYLLGFNEPNFHAQANLTPQQAASAWPALQANAKAAGIPTVSPAMNFCGPASSCNGTDPYQYLKDFFAACSGCEVDYVAVHWYNCDLPSLKDYLEPGGNLQGFEQFGKPIWLTEFACDTSASVASQEAYMRAAVPYLESNPKVFRYSWFSANPIPNAKLVNADGSPTALGLVYIGLAQSCR
jgi:putative glycosyl hydrolase